jgi:hypothetical protein
MTKHGFLRGACPELIGGLGMTMLSFLMDHGLRTTDNYLRQSVGNAAVLPAETFLV